MASSENSPMKGKWIDLINESVHTGDDVDIGDIDAVNIDFIVVKRGFVYVHYYYIPIRKVEGWDGYFFVFIFVTFIFSFRQTGIIFHPNSSYRGILRINLTKKTISDRSR
jgi:hypothetical protein